MDVNINNSPVARCGLPIPLCVNHGVDKVAASYVYKGNSICRVCFKIEEDLL